MSAQINRLAAALGAAVVALFSSGAALAADEGVKLTVQGASGAAPSAGMMAAFYIIGGLTVVGAIATITRRNPVVAAVCLVGTLFMSGGLYLLLHATFLAVLQVLVYAGAIMVLFVFVIMAVENPGEEETGLFQSPAVKGVGVLAMLFFFYRVAAVITGPSVRGPAEVAENYGDVYALGRVFFGEYLFPFEAISVLLLTAIVGAVVVSRRRAQRQEAEG